MTASTTATSSGHREPRCRLPWAALGLGTLLVLAVGVQPAESAKLDGASGFDRGMARHKRTGKPMVLFVYTDWCPHCRTFIKDTLKTPTVRTYMKGIVEVWLNPEKGRRAQAIADTYDVTGYPTVIMFPRDSKEEGRHIRRSSDPAAFVEICRAAAGDAPSDAPDQSASAPQASPRTTAAPEDDSSPAAPTVTVYLKSGEVVQGQLVGETDAMVLVETDRGQMTYFHDMIDRMVTDPLSAVR